MIDSAALWLSLQVATTGAALALVVGVLCATWLTFTRMPGRDVVDALITAPLVFPPTVLGYYLLVVLGRHSVIGRAWENVVGTPIVFTATGAVVAAFLAVLPHVVKSARTAMEHVDPSLVDAARVLGASRVRAWASIVLPLSRRGIVAGLSLGFARALGDFGVTLMIAGNIPGTTRTASLAVYDAIAAGRDADANATGAVLAAFAIAMLLLANHLTRGDTRAR